MRSLSLAAGLALALPLAAQQPAPRPLQLHFTTAGVYESNLERDEAPRPAVGGILALGVDLTERRRHPHFRISYEAALHRYSVPTRYQRTSHWASVLTLLRPAGGVSLETEAGLRLRGGAEDRDLNDEYALAEELEVRLARATAVRLTGTLRAKRPGPGLSPGRQAVARGLGVEVRQRLEAGGRFTLGARVEQNEADSARYRYARTTWEFGLESAPGRWQQVELEVAFRDQRYRSRRVDDRQALRHDYRLTPGLAWRVRPWSGFEMRLAYEYEHRSSNDPEAEYAAHQLGLSLTQTW